MTQVSRYEPGTPSWVDLGVPDAEAGRAFYTGLFGWEAEIGPAETNHYTLCKVGGRTVAGLYQLSEDQQSQGTPVVWTTYFATDDTDGTAKKLTEAGGSVLLGPLDVMEMGRMAVAQDSTGAVLGLWQAGAHTGAQLINEPGSRTWSELNTSDPDAAASFYGSVFGWQKESYDLGSDAPPYTVWKVGEDSIGGLWTMVEGPPHWAVYFEVADCDAAIARAKELGGSLLAEPTDMPTVGRFALLREPQGSWFWVMTSAPAS